MKTIVSYNPSKGFNIELGKPALIWPINHPSPLVSNRDVAITSKVTAYNADTGVFETENTIYEPVQEAGCNPCCDCGC
jgi:hypothetical protein